MQELRSELLSSSSPSPSSASQGWGGWQLVPFGNLCPLQEGSLRRRGEGRELSRRQGISKIVPCYACTNSPPGEACAQAEGFAGQMQIPSPAISSSGEDARGAQSSSNLSVPALRASGQQEAGAAEPQRARPWAGSRAGHGTHWGHWVAQVRNTGTAQLPGIPMWDRPSSQGHRLPRSETGRPGHSPQCCCSRSSSGPNWLSTERAN